MDNETIPRDDDEYDDEDYGDDDYEEDDYEDEDRGNYDQIDESENDANQQKKNNENNLGTDNKEKYDKNDEGRSRESSTKEDNKIVVVTTTVTPKIDNKKSIENISSDKYEDDDDYDDEYKEEGLGNATTLTGNKLTISDNKTVFDSTSVTSSTTNLTDQLDFDNKKEKEKDRGINRNNSTLVLPKKDIRNRQEETYEEGYEQENYGKETKNQDSDTSTEPPYIANITDNTTVVPEAKINKRIDSLDEEYDEDYDDEYYDSSDKKNSEAKIKTGNSEKEKTAEKLPEVDIDKVNTDIHEIIKNNTNFVSNTTEEAIIITTTKSQETTEIKENDDDEDAEDEYEYEDYEEEDYKDKKEEGKQEGKEVTKCEKGYTLNDNGECSGKKYKLRKSIKNIVEFVFYLFFQI